MLAARPWMRHAALAAALGLVALAGALPVWVAQLVAPQFPKGLWLRAYGDRIAGDVREINGLNHYIGMQPLSPGSIPELALWPLALGAAAALVVLGVLFRGPIGRAATLLLYAIPFAVLADIQRWLYVFGHDLDRDAPLRVAPFTPLAVGPTTVWNFRIWAWPGTALLALLGAAALVTLARRVPPGAARRRSRPQALAAAVALLIVLSSGSAADAAPSLQALADSTPPGGELVLPAGSYRGPLIVQRPITIRAAGDATIDGGGSGAVVTVRAPGTTIEGVRVRGSGGLLDDGAGIAIEADGVTVTRTRVSDAYTAIRARGARDVRIVENVIVGRAVAADAGIEQSHDPRGPHGDGISLWDVTSALVQGNRIERVRDGVYLSYASEALIDRNVVTGSRYGMHVMFGTGLMIFGNEVRANASGLVLMYPSGLTVARNTVEGHRALSTGYGLLLKDVRDGRVVENAIRANGIGLKVEGSDGAGDVLRNEISYNTVGLDVSPRTALTVSANSFIANLTQLAGSPSRVTWTSHGAGNHWSDHSGFDLNGDGGSEVDHVALTASGARIASARELRALRSSLAAVVLAKAERWWAAAERAVAVDRSPLMRPLAAHEQPAAGTEPWAFALAGGVLSALAAAIVVRRR